MQLQELQEDLFEWFEKIDDKLFVKVVTSFVYDIGTSDVLVSKILSTFIKVNGLENAVVEEGDLITFYYTQ